MSSDSETLYDPESESNEEEIADVYSALLQLNTFFSMFQTLFRLSDTASNVLITFFQCSYKLLQMLIDLQESLTYY